MDSNGHLTQEVTKTEGEQNDTFLTATSSMSQVDPRDEDCGWAEQSASQPVSYHTADGGTDLSSTTESQEDQELAGSYRYSQLPETQAQASDRASPGESPQEESLTGLLS